LTVYRAYPDHVICTSDKEEQQGQKQLTTLII